MDNRPVALITGCSHPSSLGAALLRQLVKRGWKVFASALVLESMQALADDGCMVYRSTLPPEDCALTIDFGF